LGKNYFRYQITLQKRKTFREQQIGADGAIIFSTHGKKLFRQGGTDISDIREEAAGSLKDEGMWG
jgi:hypothetical protein